jgi:hypothetical protein
MRAPAEPHPERHPYSRHAVGVAGAIRQILSLVDGKRIVRDDIQIRAIAEAVAEPISESEQRINVSSERTQLRTVGIAFQIRVRDNSAIQLEYLVKADSTAGMKRRDESHQVEVRVAARTTPAGPASGRNYRSRRRRVEERHVRPASRYTKRRAVASTLLDRTAVSNVRGIPEIPGACRYSIGDGICPESGNPRRNPVTRIIRVRARPPRHLRAERSANEHHRQ